MNAMNEFTAEMIDHELVVTRVVDAPRDLVFKVWTDPEHLKHWWGPKGCKIHVESFDLRPGGAFHYSMTWFNGGEMWGKFLFREIVEPEKLVFTNSFSDAEGNITRAPFNANWPLKILNTMTLTEHDGKTTITLRGGPLDATDADRDVFEGELESMRGGFGGTFDQLEEYLATL